MEWRATIALSFSAGALAATLLLSRRKRHFSWRKQQFLLPDGTSCWLRNASSADIVKVYQQICDLAAHENDELQTTQCDVAKAFARRDFYVLLAEIDSVVVASAIFQDSYRTWTGPSLYLQDIIVDAPLRGKGLGTLLMQGLASVAIQRGCNQMFWESHEFNAKANAFYAETVGGENIRGDHQLLTWKLVGEDRLVACAARAQPVS